MDIWDLAIRLFAIVMLIHATRLFEQLRREEQAHAATKDDVDDLMVKLMERDGDNEELRAENAELRDLNRTLAGRNARLQYGLPADERRPRRMHLLN